MLFMWKVKPIVVILAVVFILTACGGADQKKSEVLLYEETASGSAVDGKEEQYETTTVRKGTYKEEFSDTAELEYTDTDVVYIDEEDAVLDAIKVKKYQKIKKGDVLAVFHVETSKTKLEKRKLLVDQARANYESGLSDLNNSLSQAEKELKQLNTEAEKSIKRLEIKKMKKEIDTYKKGEEEVIEQEKAYAKLVRMQGKTNLVAKKGGVVTATGREYIGEEVDASSKIIEMRSNDKWILKVKDSDSKLRYNMDVTIRLGKNLKNIKNEVKGKVITASDITGVGETDEAGDNIVYVEISESDKKKYDFENNNIYIYAVSFSVKNALIVDADAVYTESVDFSNKLFVYVLENGSLHKRFIVSNYKNDEEYLVEQGVSENQTLAVIEQ